MADSQPVNPSELDAVFLDAPRDSDLTALLAYWNELRRDRLMPSRADFDPTRVPKLLAHIILYNVKPGGGYTVRLIGEAVEAFIGRNTTGNPAGTTMNKRGLAAMIKVLDAVKIERAAAISQRQNLLGQRERPSRLQILLLAIVGGWRDRQYHFGGGEVSIEAATSAASRDRDRPVLAALHSDPISVSRMTGPAASMKRFLLIGTAALAMATGLAQAQTTSATDRPFPSMPIFNPPAPSSPPPPTTQHRIDAAGNSVDTTTYYRTGPFGTYTDHTTTTTAPPGNPALGTSITH